MTRQQKTDRARALARASAAALDRPAPVPPPGPSPQEARALHRQATACVEADRRRRRMAAVPVPPPLLADSIRANNLFPLPDEAARHATGGRPGPGGGSVMTRIGTGLRLVTPAARDQAAGWDTWRRARHAFVPAPLRSLGHRRAMSARERSAYDLHRMATHATLPLLNTPMSLRMDRLLSARIRTNAFNVKPSTRTSALFSWATRRAVRSATRSPKALCRVRCTLLRGNVPPSGSSRRPWRPPGVAAEVVLSAGADQPVPRLSLTSRSSSATPTSWSCLLGAPSAVSVRRDPYR